MKFSQCIQIIKPKYVIFKLTTHNSTKNLSTDRIAQLVNKVFVSLKKRIKFEEKKLIIKTNLKVSYYIYLEKDKAEFYFIIPEQYKRLFKDKMRDCWKYIKITEVNDLPLFDNNATKYSLNYTKEDALSLSVNKKSNELLASNLNVIDILESETNDKVGILYNFIPSSETTLNSFKEYHKEIISKYKNSKPIDKNRTGSKYLVKLLFNFLVNTIDGVVDKFAPDNEVSLKNQITLLQPKDLSNTTMKKSNSTICKSQIVILSQSDNKHNEVINAKTLCESFNTIDEDNSLTYSQVKRPVNIMDSYLPAPVLDTSTHECSRFIALPGKELISDYNIDSIKVLENSVPEELQSGFFRLGDVKVKEKVQHAFKSNDHQLRRLGMVYLGSMGAGKTTFMTNNASDIINAGFGLAVIDIISSNELSEAISKIVPKDRLIRINCSKYEDIQSFAFNEIKITHDMSPYNKVANATKHIEQLATLLDSVNVEAPLRPKMKRYLYAAGKIVLCNTPGANLKNIVDCLTIPEKRKAYIEELPNDLKVLLEDEIYNLSRLDGKVDSKGNVSNNDSKVDGIIDRTIQLQLSEHTKLSFTRNSKNNYDFVELLAQNKVILIEVPESEFPSKHLRNVIATFFLSKLWLAKQILDSQKRQPTTYIMFDEFYKCYNCQLLFEDIFVEARKFDFIPILALHYLNQLTKDCKESLKASGSSYLLLQGADVKAYYDLKSHLEIFGYTEEDLLNLERYSALALVKTTKNYAAFVTKLPRPL